MVDITKAESITEEVIGAVEVDRLSLWVACLLYGGASIALGTIALLFPLTTLFALAMIVSALAFVDGVQWIWIGARRLWRGQGLGWPAILWGLGGVAVALAFLIVPILITFGYSVIVLMFLSAWAIIAGLADIGVRHRMGRSEDGGWTMRLWGTVLILLGAAIPALLFLEPQSFIGLGWVIGLFALFVGVTLVSRGLTLRYAVREAEARSSAD